MEPERLGELIDRLGPGLALYARQWTDSPEDAVQEAFVALSSLPEGPGSPAAWLYRAVRNGAINAGIAARRRRRREAEAGTRGDRWFVADRPAGSAAAIDPDAAQDALADLPAPQREVIVAHLWGGLTFGEIAELTASSASAAHRLYHAGLTTLRSRLGVACRPKTTPRRPT